MSEPSIPPLLRLPSELIHLVLSFLSPYDLATVAMVSRFMREHTLEDTLWQPFVQANTAGNSLTKPPGQTWRKRFISLHPFWFIAKNKLWFADTQHTGKLLIARYDPRLGAIEGYTLVAERPTPAFTHWDWHPEAIIHTFSPRIQLDLNAPVLRLDPWTFSRASHEDGSIPNLKREFTMMVHDHPGNRAVLNSRLILTRALPEKAITPSTCVWPPHIIPSPSRTRNESQNQFRDLGHRPGKLSELSTSTFRLRRWMQFGSRPGPLTLGAGARVGEEVTTFATLPEHCYTPTKEKPWQGIWCGDYSGHGCEFLVIMQPDEPSRLPLNAEYALMNAELDSDDESSASTEGSWNPAPTGLTATQTEILEASSTGGTMGSDDSGLPASVSTSTAGQKPSASVAPHDWEEPIYRGRLEAIKLTGDPNIPRGEYTFIAPDIGPKGLIRVATEEIFKGARVVRSVGHIAARGYRDDDYMLSQLILISPDRIAQYWETFGHVSFYQRVNIDEFTKV